MIDLMEPEELKARYPELWKRCETFLYNRWPMVSYGQSDVAELVRFTLGEKYPQLKA